jgi:antitoxin (DNA-binding transcriptional repressor) of toxin-antitoxin stability system
MTSNIAELQEHLSQYLRRVRAGETIWVKDRDRIIAKIEPVREADLENDEARMAELVAEGIVAAPKETMASEELEAFLSDPVKLNKRLDVVAMLLDEREGER